MGRYATMGWMGHERKEAYETSISDPAKNAAGQVEKVKLRPLLKKIS